jgi:hypothetical protein
MAHTVLAVVVGYVVGWALSYTIVVGTDYRWFFTYLLYAWTGGGELRTFVNIGAIATACLAVLGTWLYGRFRSRPISR